MQTKTKTAVIISIIFIFTLAVIAYYFQIKHQPKIAQNNIQVQQKTEPKPVNEAALQQQATDIVKTKDLSQCDQIQDDMYKKVCINNIALNLASEKQDVSYCQKLDDDLIKIGDCEQQIVSQKALDKEDVSVCNEAKSSDVVKQCQNTFPLSLALKKGDVSFCNQFGTDQDKASCSNAYLLKKEFTFQPSNFDCNKFVGDDLQQDCEKYIKSKVRGLGVCGDFKSPLFVEYCMINNSK